MTERTDTPHARLHKDANDGGYWLIHSNGEAYEVCTAGSTLALAIDSALSETAATGLSTPVIQKAVAERVADVQRVDAVLSAIAPTSEAEHLRMQIGYIVTQLMIAGDPRSLPEIVEEAANATKGKK